MGRGLEIGLGPARTRRQDQQEGDDSSSKDAPSHGCLSPQGAAPFFLPSKYVLNARFTISGILLFAGRKFLKTFNHLSHPFLMLQQHRYRDTSDSACRVAHSNMRSNVA
jgi:hypothetical protein